MSTRRGAAGAPSLAALALIGFLLAPSAEARAQLPESERWIASGSVAAGLHADGSLGNSSLELGLLWAPVGEEGPLPAGGDILWPGRAFEAWGLSYLRDGAPIERASAGPWMAGPFAFDWEAPVEVPGHSAIRATAADADLAVELTVDLPWGRDLLLFTFRLTALRALGEVALAKSIDADFDDYTLGDYLTLNRARGSAASATGRFDGRSIALAVEGGVAGVCAWCVAPSAVEAGAGGSSEADQQIGVARRIGDLAEGESVTVTFAYALAFGADAAEAAALEAAMSGDRDLDGASEEAGDCDDHDPSIGPEAEERGDGRDQDCDGFIDEGLITADGDGDGFSPAEGDCDDEDPATHPGAAPHEGTLDADCDGRIDAAMSWPPMGEEREVEVPASGCAVSPRGASGPSGSLIALLLAGLLSLSILRRRR